ncbi:hypothetical protein FZI85_24605 [Mycobacterium sp. CBMA293]|uniref:hypothetical protein n=2 Tax=Mycolicibacterium TaxID=1866885 RepID=UPI0012DF9AB0|nr:MULTISPECIES: hypothetical protein [unclassified Mycolicibacterium]MUM34194.1 hypothetical protein [Mycolicibacterium sp. CBMA 361]MUL45587.1 hypothetical protein [Mycolicibacterium sp. CBMA 360]MUL60257.1 hypothetical protein [Mycolicibacterium sp. CBMA 335]MUL71531.1 hypothetical protein [Mycolicibacterium sp. CBMA 311]MUL73044.1 hypothetical protein [Mycolicibacterium sp. CBMA 311]
MTPIDRPSGALPWPDSKPSLRTRTARAMLAHGEHPEVVAQACGVPLALVELIRDELAAVHPEFALCPYDPPIPAIADNETNRTQGVTVSQKRLSDVHVGTRFDVIVLSAYLVSWAILLVIKAIQSIHGG